VFLFNKRRLIMAGKQGFASMDDSKQKEIASKGGKASGGGNRSGSRNTNTNASGAAGQTEAAKRGGQNSQRNS
jgi:general stress protein YciG